MHRTGRSAWIWAVLFSGTACRPAERPAAAQRETPQLSGDTEQVASVDVPSSAPDSIPRALDTMRLARDASLPYLPNIVVLEFRKTASASDRSHAVAAVGGKVVGGIPKEGEGYYLVQISTDSGSSPLFAAIEKLKRNPAVATAGPYMLVTDY